MSDGNHKNDQPAPGSPQPPQFIEDQHGPGYDSDTPAGWLRGTGGTATNKPGFDKHRAGR